MTGRVGWTDGCHQTFIVIYVMDHTKIITLTQNET